MPVYSILTSSVSFTRRICSLRSWRSLKVDCAVMEYTRAKPWPFFMYKSLIAVNCSYTKGGKKRWRDYERCPTASNFYLLFFLFLLFCSLHQFDDYIAYLWQDYKLCWMVKSK